MNPEQGEEPLHQSDGAPVSLAAVLLRTPFGALVLATLGSIPAAALTVGVQNWGDLLRRAPWWAFGVVVAVLVISVSFVVAVHPKGRRLAGWTIGWVIGLSGGLFLFAFVWTFIFDSNAIENWATSVSSSLILAAAMVFGFSLVKRRVRDEADPRLLRSAQSAKGFLIPDDDPSIAILDKLEQMSEEIRRIHVDLGVESLAATWGGPGWLGRLAVRRGWLVSSSRPAVLPTGPAAA